MFSLSLFRQSVKANRADHLLIPLIIGVLAFIIGGTVFKKKDLPL